MNSESSKNRPKDYEIPCRLLPVTEFDMSEGVPPEQLANVPAGGFVRDELLHEPVEFDFSTADQEHFSEARMSELDFFLDLHEESYRQLAAEPARGGILELLTQQDVWTVIGVTCKVVAPAVLASIFALLWKDIWGKADIRASDVYEQNEEMMEKFEEGLEQYRRLGKKNAALEAELGNLAAQLRDLPKEAALKTASLLVSELGWEKAKAAHGVRAVAGAAAKKKSTS